MKAIFAVFLTAFLVMGCASDADVASYNLSKAADNFEVPRRIIFYNGITGEYMLVIEGLYSKGNTRNVLDGYIQYQDIDIPIDELVW